MQASIFKSSRSPFWYLHLKKEGEPARRFSLKVRDKQIAQQLKAKYVKEFSQELAEMIPSKSLRQSSVRPLLDHLDDFLRTHEVQGSNNDYLRITQLRMKKLFLECGWKYFKDISAESFNRWRGLQKNKSAKTLNHYLTSVGTILRWLEMDGKIAGNPLKSVQPTTRPGGKRRVRRAFTTDEIWRLLEVADKTSALIIRLVVLSGLRRNEVALLQWGDFHLEAIRPFILLRSETVKNRKGKPHVIHPDLVGNLKAIKPQLMEPSQAVFPEMPDMDDHRELLKAAGVHYIDESGHYADFHSFRKTHATNLQLAGINQRTAMEQMRLSSPRLLDHVYTDCALLQTGEAVAKLDGFLKCTKKGDKDPVPTGPDQSVPVQVMDVSGSAQLFCVEDPSPLGSNPVPISQEKEDGSGGRARTSFTSKAGFRMPDLPLKLKKIEFNC